MFEVMFEHTFVCSATFVVVVAVAAVTVLFTVGSGFHFDYFYHSKKLFFGIF